jgi:uncharacterized repeat protein (TIGR01451 family)
VVQEYGKLPLSFEANQGQVDARVKFLSRGPGYQLSLLPDRAVLTIRERLSAKPIPKKFGVFHTSAELHEREAVQYETLSMALVGAARDARVTGVEEMPGKSNYFLGNDPAKWRTNVTNFAKVRYEKVYPGIDLIYHGSQQQLEYDFVVAPGADAHRIRLKINGAKKLEMTPEGDLLVGTSLQPVRLHKPVVYQEFAGTRKEILGSFVLAAKNTVKFRVGAYDHSRQLVIDPVFVYSTALGGNGFDEAFAIALDTNGNAYITGDTTSTNFATAGAFQTTLANNCGTAAAPSSCQAAFVAKLNPNGNGLVYVTYLGGTSQGGAAQGTGIAVFSGNAYVAGQTTFSDFPTTTGAFQTTKKGFENYFIAQLNAAGSGLVFSTYLGGSNSEFSAFGIGNSLALDGSGNSYVTGGTTSFDFPTANPIAVPPFGGTYKSTDHSGTWSLVGSPSSGLTNLNILTLAVDPTNSAIVYAGTAGSGLFKSTNGGQAWTRLSGLPVGNVESLAVDPKTPTMLYVGSAAKGVFKSTDGGTTWTAINTGLAPAGTVTFPQIMALVVDPNNDLIVYAGDIEGLFKTVDGGANWTSLSTGFPPGFGTNVQAIAIDPASNVYVGTVQGMFKSTNGGASFTAINNGLVVPGTTTTLDIRSIAIDSIAPLNVYVITFNGVGVFKSADGGNSWNAVNSGLTDDRTRAIVADPTVSGTLYVGTIRTGVFETTNGGASWMTANNAISNFFVTALAVDKTTPANVYAGSQVEKTFVSKLNSTGTGLVFSTYLGGSSGDFGGGIAVDGTGNAYVTGETLSRNFPTLSAFQASPQSGDDGYVTKLSPSGALSYSTYLGGTNDFSAGTVIASDSLGSAYVAGVTLATNFPTVNPFQSVNHTQNAFVTKFSPSGTSLVYSTFFGGSTTVGGSAGGLEEPFGIAVDGAGNAWIAGFTESADFPTVNPIRSSAPCVLSFGECFGGTFLSELNPAGSTLLFSTFLGPSESFQEAGVALDSQGSAYVAGATSGTAADFPAVNPLPNAPTSGTHAFVTKIANTATSTDLAITALTHTPDPVFVGNNVTITVMVTNNGTAAATGVTIFPTSTATTTVSQFTTLVSDILTQGTCNADLFCFIGTLSPGQSVTATYVLTAQQAQQGTIVASFGVGSNESDPTPGDNVASTTINVTGGVDLQLLGTTSPAPATAGGSLTYTLFVNNKGANPASNVVLSDTLPTGYTISTATFGTPAQSCAIAAQNVTCLLGALLVQNSDIVTITGIAPATMGTLINNAAVTATETQINPGHNVLQQITDVVAGVGTNNPLNKRFNGLYGLLMQGEIDTSTPVAPFAMIASVNADGVGGITGTADTNLSTGFTPSQPFTGTYNVGNDSRVTMTITFPGGPTFTYRVALGAFNAQGIATKASLIQFDASGRNGSGFMTMQDPTALGGVSGDFAYGGAGQTNALVQVAEAGRFTLSALGGITNGLQDSDTGGTLQTAATFTGSASAANSTNGRGTFTLNFTSPAATSNFVYIIISARETIFISSDPRTTNPLISGRSMRQATNNFSNAWLNGNGVFNLSGVEPGGTDVQVGLATLDGAGNISVVEDHNNAGVVTLNQPGSVSKYSVAANGRTTFTGAGGNQPVLFLDDLNAGFLVDTGVPASTGRLEQQAAGPLNNSTASGPFFLGQFRPSALGNFPIIGEGTLSAGTVQFTEDGSAGSGVLLNDIVFSDTLSVAANGRTTVSDGTIAWVIGPSKVISISAKAAKINDLVTVLESGNQPSVNVTVTVNPTSQTVTVGTQLSFVFTISNTGTIPATGVSLSDLLSSNFTLVSATAGQGACTQTTQVTCALGSIANGTSATVTITVTATTATTGAITNSGLLSVNEVNTGTPTSAATSITINPAVTGSADMALVKTVSPTSVIQGGNLTYTLTATNNGPSAATNVKVMDALPASTTFVPSLSSASCSGTTTITCNLGGVAVAASATANIVVSTTGTSPGTVTNTATVSADQTDPNPVNNSSSATATVLASGTSTFESYILTDVSSPEILEFNTSSPSATPLATAHAGTNPDGIAISPNGRIAYVGNVNANFVSVIDLTFNAEIARIRNIHANRNLALSPDGTHLVVPSLNADEVDIIDTSTFQVLNRVSLSTLLGDTPNGPQVGLGSVVVVGHFAYVNAGVGIGATVPPPVVVVDINAGTATAIANSNVGFPRVHGNTIAATPDGKFVAVTRVSATSATGNLLIINTATNTVAQNLSLSALPSSIAITRNAADPNGIFGYMQLGTTSIAAVDFNPGSGTFGQLVAGGQVTLTDNVAAGSIALTADGSHVIVTSRAPGVAHNVNVLSAQGIRTGSTANIVQLFVGSPGSAVIDSIAIGPIQQAVPASAPVISNVSPPLAPNSATIPVQITGSGFASGALVRVGDLDPIVSTGNATTINVTVPAFAAAQTADIVVTNPNSTSPISGQQISSIVTKALQIQPPASFQPANQLAVTNTGDNSVAILNDATKAIATTAVSPGPLGMAISADGARAFPLSFRKKAVDDIDLDSGLLKGTIQLPSDTAIVGQVDAIVTAPNIGGTAGIGDPAEFVLTTSVVNQTAGTSDLRLVIIDSNPTSPTFNQIVGTIQGGTPDTGAFPGALGVKPDGTFAYGNDANNGDLAIFDLTKRATTIIPVATIKDAVFQGHIEVTQDGNSLVLVNPTGSLLVFDIGTTNAANPALVATITGSTPSGLNPLGQPFSSPMFSSFRVVGKDLFAFDGTQNIVEVFHFDRVTPNFSQISSFVVPGHQGLFSSGFAIAPDGNLMYLALEEDDAMAVLSVPQLLVGGSSPLITTLRTGLDPSAIVISPAKAPVADAAITGSANPTTVAVGAPVTFTFTVTDNGPSDLSGVMFTDTLPTGLTVQSAVPSQGSCTTAPGPTGTTVTCNVSPIANGAKATVSIIAKANATGSITNTGSVTANETDPNPANNSASAIITVNNASVCNGATIVWSGAATPADGQFTTPANWNPARLPGPNDFACIDVGFAGSTITLASSQITVNRLVAESTLQLNGTLAATSLTITGTIGSNFANNVILSNAALNVNPNSSINGTLTSSGTSSIGSAGSTVVVNGGITVNGGTLTIAGNSLTNSGTATIALGSTLQLQNGTTLNNPAGATFSLNGGTISGGAALNNGGATNIASNSTIATPLSNAGTINVGGNATFSGVYTQTGGQLSLHAAITNSSSLNINGGALTGNGVISGALNMNGGVLAPGPPTGIIAIDSAYTQSVNSALNISIGGNTSGTQYSVLNAPQNGTVTLAGTLNVSLIGGFVPVAGNSFTVVSCVGSATCRAGTFSVTNFPALPNGLVWTIAYNANSVVINVSTPAAGCAAGSNQWTGTAGNNLWATATNWSTGAIPTATDSVCIGTAFTNSTITVGVLAAANQTIANLNSNATLNFSSGPLTITGAATFANALNVSGGTLTLNGASAVQGAFGLAGGTLTGSSPIIASGLITWTAGTISGASTLAANGGLNLPSGSAVLDTRTINVTGATTQGGAATSSSLVLQNGAIVNNSAGSIWSIVNGNGSGIINNGGTSNTFNNAGTFQMTGGTSNQITVPFNNTGSVSVTAGTLRFSGGGICGGTCAGPFAVGTGAILNFQGGTFALSGLISGAGTVNFSGGTVNHTGTYNISGATMTGGGTANFTGTFTNGGPLTIAGGTANFSVPGTITTPTLTMSSGTLTGSSPLTVTGLITWTAGTISGASTLAANGGLNLPSGSAVLDTRTINVTGATTQGGAATSSSLVLQNSAIVNNSAGSTWSIVNGNGSGIINNGGTSNTFNNAGTFQMTGGTSNSISVAFNNTGSVNAAVGTLRFSGGGNCGSTCAGPITVGAGATLNFQGGTFALGGVISGLGTVDFSGGTVNVTGTYNISGATSASGGTANITGTFTNGGSFTLTSGVLNINVPPPITVPTLTMSGGTLTGAAPIIVSGLITWTGGTISGASFINANVGLSLPSGAANLDTRTLNVAGATTEGSASTGSNIALSNGAVINNLAGSTWSIVNANGNGISNNGGTGNTFNNAGTFQMTGGTLASISSAFNNSGTVSANAGTLSFSSAGGFTQTSGVTIVNGGKLSSPTALAIQGGTLMGVDVAAPPTIAAPISNTGGIVHPGLSPGVLSTSGSFTQNVNGSLSVDINGTTPGTGYSQLNVAGAVTLAGALNVTLLNSFAPASGNTFTILNCTATAPCISGTFPTVNFSNAALPAGLGWTITYNPTSVVLSVGAATGADLAITKTAPVNKIAVGVAPFTYTITVTNNGPQQASGVTVNDTLPTQITLFAPPTTNVGTCGATNPITCNIGTLNNGASATISIQVQPTTIGTATNTATVTGTQTDPNSGNNSSTATVQIVGTADLQITKTTQPNPVNVGSNLTYTLTLVNAGPNQATGVSVTDALPAGVIFASANASQGTCSGTATVNCNLGNLAVNSPATITIVVTPTTVGSISNTATVVSNEVDPTQANNTSTATVTVNPVADLALSATGTPNPDGVNNPLTAKFTVVNKGPSPATGVNFSGQVPTSGTVTNVVASQGNCDGAFCALGTLASGATATVTLTLNPTAAGPLTVTGNVAANETDPVPANNTASVTVPINPSSDLAITETVGTSPILLGNNLSYFVTITNNGPSDASNVTLTDILPPNSTLIPPIFPAVVGAPICTAPVNGRFTCNSFNLANGASIQFRFDVTPNAAGSFTNSVSVSDANFDPNPANNSSSATGVVNGAADLSLQVNAPQSVFVGNNITFAYTIQNAGPSNATGVTLTDTLPAGLTFVSSTPPVCTGGVTVTCNVGNVANGASASVSIVASVNASGKFINTANVFANESDPFPSNNTAIDSFSASASADLAISIASAPPTPVVGLNLTFTLTIMNNGPSPATGVTVVNQVPAGTSFVSATPSQGSPCSAVVSCALGNLASGASATVAIVLAPQAAGTVSDTGTVSANEPDPNAANNSRTVTVTVINHPTVSLSVQSINFASQPVGTSSAAQAVTLTNQSTVLAVTSLTIAASGDFSETDNCGTGLAPSASCIISVTFKPTATGTRTGAITLTDNALGSPQSVSLTGLGINAPAISLAPTSLTFSSQRVGSQSASQPVTMTNGGNAILNISSISITGSNPNDFGQTNNCNTTLAPNATCTINVTFKPTAGGQRTAGISISSDARGSVPTVTLSGTGVSTGLDLSPSIVIFNNQVVGTTSAAQPVTVSNAGATAIAISSISATGDFSETDNCGNSIAANSNCTIQVTFKPTATASRTGSLNVTAADSATPHSVSLSGTGVVVTLTLMPTSLTFNSQTVGTTSQSQLITLTNTGGASLTIDSIVPSGDFLETNNCGSIVAAGASCAISVTFTPTATGTRPGSITVNSNAQGSPQTAALTGTGAATGPAVSLSCSAGTTGSVVRRNLRTQAVGSTCFSLSFPSQAVGSTSAPQTVVLTNIGNDVLTIDLMNTVTGGDFAISSNTCPQMLAAGSACNIAITFNPTATGPRVGSLSVKDNAGDSPQSLILMGTGTPSGPSASLSATALPFGGQLVGTTSAAQSVTVTNTGNAQLTFSSVGASGDFAKTSDTCTNAIVAPNATCSISVTFTPTTTNARAGAITITDNAPDSPQSVTLSGNGMDISISPPPGSSNSASVSAGQSATFPLMIAPSGGFNGNVTVACVGMIPGGTCTSSPSSFALNAVVTVNTTITTSKASSSAMVVPGPTARPGKLEGLRLALQALLALAVLFALALVARLRGAESRVRFRRTWAWAATGVLLAALSSSLSGCAGGSGNPGIVGPTAGTPSGAYNVNVVITTSTGATRSFQLTINVH